MKTKEKMLNGDRMKVKINITGNNSISVNEVVELTKFIDQARRLSIEGYITTIDITTIKNTVLIDFKPSGFIFREVEP